jgi:hypothetical protein
MAKKMRAVICFVQRTVNSILVFFRFAGWNFAGGIGILQKFWSKKQLTFQP